MLISTSRQLFSPSPLFMCQIVRKLKSLRLQCNTFAPVTWTVTLNSICCRPALYDPDLNHLFTPPQTCNAVHNGLPYRKTLSDHSLNDHNSQQPLSNTEQLCPPWRCTIIYQTIKLLNSTCLSQHQISNFPVLSRGPQISGDSHWKHPHMLNPLLSSK